MAEVEATFQSRHSGDRSPLLALSGPVPPGPWLPSGHLAGVRARSHIRDDRGPRRTLFVGLQLLMDRVCRWYINCMPSFQDINIIDQVWEELQAYFHLSLSNMSLTESVSVSKCLYMWKCRLFIYYAHIIISKIDNLIIIFYFHPCSLWVLWQRKIIAIKLASRFPNLD